MEFNRNMARFCLATGVQPSEYLNMTAGQVEAFVKAWNEANKRR